MQAQAESGQVAILKQDEGEAKSHCRIHHAVDQCGQDVLGPGDHGTGGDGRTSVEKLERWQDEFEEACHELNEVVRCVSTGGFDQNWCQVPKEEYGDAEHHVHKNRQTGRNGHADGCQETDFKEDKCKPGKDLKDLAQTFGRDPPDVSRRS